MDFETIMARLAEATDAELGEALTAIGAAAQELRSAPATDENVTRLEGLAAARGQIQAEQTRRVELSDRQAAALANFTEDGTEDEEEATEEEAATETEGDEDEADEDAAEETEEEAPAEGGPAVTAGAKPRKRVGSMSAKRTGNKPPAKKGARVVTTARVQGNIPGFEAGQAIDRAQLATAMSERFNTLNRTSADGRYHVARIQSEFPEARMLTKDSWAVNTERIEAATGQEALVAAGGLCAPLETDYAIANVGVTARPIRDALTRFGVERGGITWRAPFDALAMSSGLGVWTLDDDEAVGVVEDPDVPDPSKTCFVVECPGLNEATIYSTYLCLEFPNITTRFDREWTDATNRAADVAHARFAENPLLQRLLAGSKHLTAAKAVSAVRDVLVNLDKTIAYYRSKHRLDSMVPLRMILPAWVKELFRADLTRGFAGDLEALAVADATIQSWFRARGVNITFHLDGLAANNTVTPNVPAQVYANVTANSAIPGFIDRIDAVLFVEGEWLFLDGGILDLGLVRDSTLNAKNRYRTFMETFEGVAFKGVETLRLNMEVQPTGSTAGTISTAFTD
ncbi:MAG: major capsid protein [Giesbergeria sp.]